jgi:hypothetical protein
MKVSGNVYVFKGYRIYQLDLELLWRCDVFVFFSFDCTHIYTLLYVLNYLYVHNGYCRSWYNVESGVKHHNPIYLDIKKEVLLSFCPFITPLNMWACDISGSRFQSTSVVDNVVLCNKNVDIIYMYVEIERLESQII